MLDEKRMYLGQTEAPVTRELQSTAAFNALEMTVEEHIKLAGELERRLEVVLRNEPEATSEKAKDPRTLVPVAERIDSIDQHLQSLLSRYRSILHRLEI